MSKSEPTKSDMLKVALSLSALVIGATMVVPFVLVLTGWWVDFLQEVVK